MPTFKIIDIFKITDKGVVLSGHIIDDGLILSGDNAIMTTDPDPVICKIIGIDLQKQPKHFGLLISFKDFERLPKFDFKGTNIKIINVADRKQLTKEPVVWTGDLSDDCTATWAGLMLRAERMDENYWWWAVYDIQNDEITIDSSNNYDRKYIGGQVSRKKAEDAAKRYLNIT